MTFAAAGIETDTAQSLPTVEEAYAFCREITHRHGANFSVGFRFLPPEKKRAVHAAYAYCRWADDIADDPGRDLEERLSAWQAELHACYEGHPRHLITIALADSLRYFEIPMSAFEALIAGCRQDLIKKRYQTFDELVTYCDLVSTSISDISLSIFGYRTPAAKEHGRNLATALQLTNITRDVGDDLGRDRVYVPVEELERFGVTEEDLRSGREGDNVGRLILFQVERARSYFQLAQPLLHELTFDARFPTLLMGSVYSSVLDEIEKNPFRVLRERISLSTARKIRVVLSRIFHSSFS
ncbi:MAG TPA: squalene/phytoene synthase family protein [Thermoanaerobaculia bacterium]|nr:squalene/phytoene synthase family protein [Thermoanaerobaculia bacterium]